MYELAQIIPDAEVLLSLEPEELGAKLLFLLRKRGPSYGLQPGPGGPVLVHEHGQTLENTLQSFHPQQLIADLWPHTTLPNHQTPYPRDQRDAIELAVTEAFAWLEAQGLVIPAAGASGQNGWRRLSRRARRFESEAEFTNYAVARMLRRESLHPEIADRVWMAFMRGEFDVAAFQAMKAVDGMLAALVTI